MPCTQSKQTLTLALSIFVIGCPLFLSNSLSAASSNNLASNTANVEQEFDATTEEWKNLSTGKLAAKQRARLNRNALRAYLKEYASPNLKNEDEKKRFKELNKELNTDFSQFVPSTSLVALPQEGRVRATLQVSVRSIQGLLRRHGFPISGNTVNVDNANQGSTASNNLTKLNSGSESESGSQKNEETKDSHIPFISLLIDEKNRDVYVWPPETLTNFITNQGNPNNGIYTFKPAANIKRSGVNDLELNSQVSYLDLRAAQFAAKTLFYLEGQKVKPDATWGSHILQFVMTSSTLDSTRPWPLALPWSMSTLKSNPGVVAVFAFRSADQTGILEKLDFVGMVKGKLIRQYWSRGLNDPGYTDSAAKALERIGTSFSRLQRVKAPILKKNSIEFKLDKRISDKDLAKLESTIRKYALGEENILIPIYVGKSGIKYQSAISVSKADDVFQKVQRSFPQLSVKLRTKEQPAEIDMVTPEKQETDEDEPLPETVIVLQPKTN